MLLSLGESKTYEAGAEMTLSATPEEGWEFSHWSGGASGSDNPAKVVLKSDAEIVANFVETDSDNDGLSDNYEKSITGVSKYQIIEGSYTWDEAKVDAEARGGHLAAITSEAEQKLVNEISNDIGHVWIGGTDASNEGSWEWVTGENWGFENWNSGDPNQVVGNGECFLTLLGGNTGQPVGKWNDSYYGGGYSYILEIPSVALDPNNPDTDGDGLLDGLEVNTHETNPALADTDSDGALDGMEVYQGSDPKDAGSKPAINLLVSGSTAVSPVSAHGTDLLEIKLEDDSEGVVLMYSLDGSNPIAGEGFVYSGPFSVNEPVSIRAVSLDASFNKVAELKPVILNVMPVVSETVEKANTYLKLTTADPESTIYYTIDGSDPLQKGVKYEGPLYVEDAGTVRAVAYKGPRDGLVVADKVTVEELPGYSLSVTTTGGGSVSADPWQDKYLAGTKIKLTATAEEGWQFMGWQGKAVGSELETEITINGDTDVSAQFGTGLTLTAIGGGNIKAYPERELYSYGSKVQLSAVPDDGKYLVMWGRRQNRLGTGDES